MHETRPPKKPAGDSASDHPQSNQTWLEWPTALARLSEAYAETTLRAYRADVAQFEAWCEARGQRAFPAKPELIRRYLDQGLRDHAAGSVRRKLSALRKIHEVLGLPDPTRDGTVALSLHHRLRLNRRRPRQALGLTEPLRDRLLAACPPTLRGARDRALIAVGYDILARRSELVSLRLEDLQVMAVGGARILIRRSKTDPHGEGRYAYLSDAAHRQLAAWVTAAKLDVGPIFRPVLKNHRVQPRALTGVAVNRILKSTAQRAGLDPTLAKRLSGHSLRVGAAQDLVRHGKSLPQVMLAGRWATADAVAHYSQEADLNIWA
jgi:site-specific recombinase XerD